MAYMGPPQSQYVCIANVHMSSDQRLQDVKLFQTHVMMSVFAIVLAEFQQGIGGLNVTVESVVRTVDPDRGVFDRFCRRKIFFTSSFVQEILPSSSAVISTPHRIQ